MDIVPKALAVNIGDFFSPAKNFPDVASIVNVLIPNIMVIAGVIFLFMFIIAGFRFITKAGQVNSEELKKILNTMAAAAIGIIIIFAAYWIVRIIEILTGANILNPNL